MRVGRIAGGACGSASPLQSVAQLAKTLRLSALAPRLFSSPPPLLHSRKRGSAAKMALDKSRLDYSLYLVTGRELLPPGVDYYHSLELSLKQGHVTMVQIREKDHDTAEVLDVARRSLEICDRYNVPMLINDNLSVALSLPPRVGLHIGQTDLPLAQARALLGPERLLGISLNTVAQAHAALASGAADYAGVGPCFGTTSKKGITEEKILGPSGAQRIVEALAGTRTKPRLPCVLIGGINQETVTRALNGATGPLNSPDGVAVISAIVARNDPDVAAKELGEAVKAYKEARHRAATVSSVFNRTPNANGLVAPLRPMHTYEGVQNRDYFISSAGTLLQELRQRGETGAAPPPLVQIITSHVSSPLSANMALAFGASPIMSHEAAEAEDLGRVIDALVLNIGTVSAESRQGMKHAAKWANKRGIPVVLDPVGCGATAFRMEVVKGASVV
ncbi:thiamine biosynthetic bifunctional enzyme [Thecaphora frezii]